MLRHYLTLAIKVLRRRKFFTFISLFGISLTLLVLMVVTAIMDHSFAPGAPETRLDRTLYVNRVVMHGPHNTWSSSGGFRKPCARPWRRRAARQASSRRFRRS